MKTKSSKIAMTIAMIACSTAISFADNGNGSCMLSSQLQESKTARIQYMMRVTKVNSSNYQAPSNPEEMYDSIVQTSFNSSESDIDEMSFECITCHDGLAAPTHLVRVKNNPNGGRNLNANLNNHPIGMDYSRYVSASRSFRPINSNGPMVFANGKVGCLTCHNPLNPEKNHLVMDNHGSALCLTCHNK